MHGRDSVAAAQEAWLLMLVLWSTVEYFFKLMHVLEVIYIPSPSNKSVNLSCELAVTVLQALNHHEDAPGYHTRLGQGR